MSRYLPHLLICGLLIAGCSNGETGPADALNVETVIETTQSTDNNPIQDANSDDALTARGVMLLAWEDLMPEGEDARLEELYAEFYRDFEARMMAQQSTLSSTLNSEEGLNLSLITEGSDMDTMEQIGTFNVVDDLDGKTVRLPGYIVPLDFSTTAEHKEFLLVPYFGACLHSPPPPPNQIIFVSANPPAKIPDIYDPVWIEGTMTTGRFDTEMGNSAYEISLSKVELYEY